MQFVAHFAQVLQSSDMYEMGGEIFISDKNMFEDKVTENHKGAVYIYRTDKRNTLGIFLFRES